jgi:hypothetical protein
VTSVHLGCNAARHHHGPECIGMGAGADQGRGSGHDRVVVPVAELATRPARGGRLRSAAFTPHEQPSFTRWSSDVKRPSAFQPHDRTAKRRWQPTGDLLLAPPCVSTLPASGTFARGRIGRTDHPRRTVHPWATTARPPGCSALLSTHRSRWVRSPWSRCTRGPSPPLGTRIAGLWGCLL